MSYSKEPPQRFVALSEIFEGATDLIGFHGRTWELASGGWYHALQVGLQPDNTLKYSTTNCTFSSPLY
jgi:hypothetical protein